MIRICLLFTILGAANANLAYSEDQFENMCAKFTRQGRTTLDQQACVKKLLSIKSSCTESMCMHRKIKEEFTPNHERLLSRRGINTMVKYPRSEHERKQQAMDYKLLRQNERVADDRAHKAAIFHKIDRARLNEANRKQWAGNSAPVRGFQPRPLGRQQGAENTLLNQNPGHRAGNVQLQGLSEQKPQSESYGQMYNREPVKHGNGLLENVMNIGQTIRNTLFGTKDLVKNAGSKNLLNKMKGYAPAWKAAEDTGTDRVRQNPGNNPLLLNKAAHGTSGNVIQQKQAYQEAGSSKLMDRKIAPGLVGKILHQKQLNEQGAQAQESASKLPRIMRGKLRNAHQLVKERKRA